MTPYSLTEKYPQVVTSGNWDTKPGYCVVESYGYDLFSCFYCIIYGVLICMRENISPLIFIGTAGKDENVFTRYYHSSLPGNETSDLSAVPKITVRNPYYFLQWCRSSIQERKIANYVINAHFNLKEAIRENIAGFHERNFGGQRVLGVYFMAGKRYDGTYSSVFAHYERKITELLSERVADIVFFCTDQTGFTEYLENKLGDRLISYNREKHKSSGDPGAEAPGVAPASRASSEAEMDKIIACYLLSKCDFLLSSSKSGFPLFSTFINPSLSHIILND